MNAKKIYLNHGKYSLVDEDDYEFLMQWKWSFSSNGYAVRFKHLGFFDGKQKRDLISMHRVIMGTQSEMQTDHINGDRLDNRKCNLRVCTHKQNLRNQKPQIGRSSKYKGVSWHKNNLKWQAQIKIDGKIKHIGSFVSERDAANAYNEFAKIYFGEFARINNVDDTNGWLEGK